MKASLFAGLVVLVACGSSCTPDASNALAPTAACPNPRPAPSCGDPAPGCSMPAGTGGYCALGTYSEPGLDGSCRVPFTTGTLTMKWRDVPFAANLVAARRMDGCMMEIAAVGPSSWLRIVVPDSVGTYACAKESGAWVTFFHFSGTRAVGYTGEGTGSVTVSAIGNEITGTFSVDDANADLTEGKFAVEIADQ